MSSDEMSSKERTMYKTVLSLSASLAAFAISQGAMVAQGPPKEAIDISAAQIQAVLAAHASIDNTIRVIDMGTYAMSVAVIHRGATPQPGAARGAGAGGAGRGAAAGGGAAGRGANAAGRGAAAAEPCGLKEAAAGAQMSPPGMIAHN